MFTGDWASLAILAKRKAANHAGCGDLKFMDSQTARNVVPFVQA